MDQWLHLQQGVYPAYISWSQFVENQARIEQNSTLFAVSPSRQGSAREGTALLQGLAICGRCGARMMVCYKATHRYFCHSLKQKTLASTCGSLHGLSLDKAVVEAFFDALRPAQLDALEAVLAQQTVEFERVDRYWQDQLKRANYEVRLAQRQYNTVDPENRLVASELERRWEEKLRELRNVEEGYMRFQQRPVSTKLTPEQKVQFQHLSETLPAIWSSGKLSFSQQKELLRSLISQVILKRIAPDQVEVKIVWISGHYSCVIARPPISRECDVTGYQEMVDRVQALCKQGLNSDEEIATKLTQEGFHSSRSEGVKPKAVQKIRLTNGWYTSFHQCRGTLELDGKLTILGLSKYLNADTAWIYRQIVNGKIDPCYVSRHPHSKNWLIQATPELLERLVQLCPK